MAFNQGIRSRKEEILFADVSLLDEIVECLHLLPIEEGVIVAEIDKTLFDRGELFRHQLGSAALPFSTSGLPNGTEGTTVGTSNRGSHQGYWPPPEVRIVLPILAADVSVGEGEEIDIVDVIPRFCKNQIVVLPKS
jgi:hypothetical protein